MFVYLHIVIKNWFIGLRKKAFFNNDKFIY